MEIVTRVNSDVREGKQFLQDQLSRINYLKHVDMKFIANKEFTNYFRQVRSRSKIRQPHNTNILEARNPKYLIKIAKMNKYIMETTVVKSVYKRHSREPENVAFMISCSLYTA